MLLAIDVGNTNTVLGLFKDREIVAHWRIQTNPAQMADELAASLKGLFSIDGLSFSEITGVIIASVVPQSQSAWQEMSVKHFSIKPMRVSQLPDTGLKILMDNPSEVGADRIVNSLAGYDRYKTSLIIVDLGTAITFDCVSGKGEYLGGAITPGLSISLEALGMRTAKLPRVDISIPPVTAIGKNTIDAIKSGILFGYGGMIEELVKKIREEMLPDVPKVIATGGMAGLIAPFAPSIEAVLPMLTLDGLRLLYERNIS
ncbi:MAG: type III pantothenate kinase [Proteobacteria bacterium]|nr:type III pantothenate kinase [Pseudomonadota bacterium]MBU1736624.1 type III pantothenate kinase [Pseudomonadota bacterium]